MWQRWTYVSWGAWWEILTEVLRPPNPGQSQTPLRKIETITASAWEKPDRPGDGARLTGGQGLHGEPGSGEECHVLQRTPLSTVLQVVLLQLRQRDKTPHHPLILDVDLRETRKEELIGVPEHQRSGTSSGLPCSTWGCLAYCWRRSGRLSYQTGCGPRTPPSRSRWKTISGRMFRISSNGSISGTGAGPAFMSPAIPGSLQLLW